MEEWRTIPSLPLYEASNLGRIRRTIRSTGPRCEGGVLNPTLDRTGYLRICASMNGIPYHGLVHWYIAEAFLGPCAWGYCIHHKDGNKRNNHISNLEYLKICEHQKLCSKGEDTHRAKLTKKDIYNIRWLLRLNINNSEIVKILRLPVDSRVVSKIKNRKLWSHIK